MAGGFKSEDKLYIGEAKDKAAKAQEKMPGKGVSSHWWLESDDKIARAIYAQCIAIIKNDQARIALIHLGSKLYSGNDQGGIQSLGAYTGMSIGMGRPGTTNTSQRMGYNIIQANVDSLVAKMVKNKPMPYFLTSKGDSKLQRRAKGLNDFVKGTFYENSAYDMGRRALRDCAIWPIGLTQVYREHGRIKMSRVLPEEILVDYLESHYGEESTRTLHRLRIVDRASLISRFPEAAEKIAGLAATADSVVGAYKSVSDCVAVFESWHLPSSPDAGDGCHCITSGDVLLFREQWKRPAFPFAMIRYNEHTSGFWGQSLAEQLMPIQYELNRILRLIQQSTYMMGTFKWLVHNGSKIIDSHLDNRVGTIVKWSGNIPPEPVTPPAVQPEILARPQELIALGEQVTGLSQLSVSSQKPAGLDSGKALETYHDIESDRHQVIGQAWESYYLQLANLCVLEARDLHEELKAAGKGGLSVKVPGKKFLDTIDWKDVDMEEDQYHLQCYPVSKLPSDPAGRLATIQELIQGGFISQDVGNRLLDFPDLDAEQTLQTAMQDYLHSVLDGIVEDGEKGYRAPEPDDNLQMALKLAIEYLTVGKRDRLADDRMDLLRTYIQQVQDLVSQAAIAAAPPAGGAPTAQPTAPANPEPTPTSPLIPNTNAPMAS